MLLVDTHAHLDEESFEVDRGEVLERARQQGVRRIVTLGTTLATSRRAVALTRQYSMLYAAVGVHPNYVTEVAPGEWDEIVALARQPKVVAIGETGLDQYWKSTPLELQQDFFRRQIALSFETGLPFVVHCREAQELVLHELRTAAAASSDGRLKGIMHSYAGNLDGAREALALGLYVSIAGMVTYKKSQELRELVPHIPADRLLVETDSPYLPPQPMRGKRNEPGHVKLTLECLAQLRGVPAEELARQTTENACRLFGWPFEDVAEEPSA